MSSTIKTAHKGYKDKEKRRAYLRKWNSKNFRNRLYGLSLAAYKNLIKAQDSLCKICKKKTKKLDVDHCHATNVVRGLLCRQCNMALGLFRDDPRLLKEAAKYVDDY